MSTIYEYLFHSRILLIGTFRIRASSMYINSAIKTNVIKETNAKKTEIANDTIIFSLYFSVVKYYSISQIPVNMYLLQIYDRTT